MPNDVLPPISYAELFERLSDPDSDLDQYMHYLVEVPVPERMGPELQPNPALVTDIPPRPEGGAREVARSPLRHGPAAPGSAARPGSSARLRGRRP